MIMQSLKMAWESIRANKMRSFLTMLGIIIGVFSLVVLVSIISGATGSITDSISSMGSESLIVTIMDNKGKTLSYSELQGIKDLDSVSLVSPYVSVSTTMKGRRSKKMGTVYGVNGSYSSITSEKLVSGRYLTNTDDQNSNMVAVVSGEFIEDVLGVRSPDRALGEQFTVMRTHITVVGVLEKTDTTENAAMFGMSSYMIYVPYSLFVKMNPSARNIYSFMATAASASDLKQAQADVGDWLMKRYNDEEAFYIINYEEVMNILGDVTSTLSVVMGGVAAISLLVGGIGIMNIMLVSVTERTREIGIRKAIGASRQSILTQFLIEAMMISILGCFVGILLSWMLLRTITNLWGKIDFNLDPGIVVLACVFSLAIGLIFGLYPANKAAKKNPIDALHYAG